MPKTTAVSTNPQILKNSDSLHLKTAPIARRAQSIIEFCESYGISRASFYNLDAQGKAPATINVGRRRLITDSAAQAWEVSMSESSQIIA